MMQLHISVRNLVEFIFREGDIDNRISHLQSADAMMEGTRIHRKIQKSMGEEYQAEVPLKYIVEAELYELTIEGRADGIFPDESENITYIDEIKGMYKRVELMEEPYYVHKAQAMCYAFIMAYQNELSKIGVQMTYVNLETEEVKRFREQFTFEEIEKWFMDLVEQYSKWADFQCRWKIKRQESIKALEFPFEYREGQRKLVGDVYRTILRQKNLFLQAPTGVGKTISTIFPAVKAVGEGLGERIFYLTAKTITATVARETFSLLMEKGYKGKVIQITAKEKMCVCEEMECNPVNCPYAKGHYDRVNDAVYELLSEKDMFTREELLEQARKHEVCPFEMSLDVSTWSDAIICDYNYVFDPNVYLKRFFQDGIKGDNILLVDEAHNLVDRSREMYSAQLYKEDFLAVKKIIKPYSRKLEKHLEKCNRLLLEYKRECDGYQLYENVGNLFFSLMRLSSELDEFLQKPMEFQGHKEVLDFYFALRNFMNIYELVDEHYVIYTEHQEDGRFMLKLFCVDPSANIQACLDKANSTVFFSATLLPINYYKSLLSTLEDNYAVYATSAFAQEQSLLLMGKDVSTKYTRRNRTEYEKIASYIKKAVSCRQGNYFVFFPSYKLMKDVYEVYSEMDDTTEAIMQKAGMKETEREEFLERFAEDNNTTLVAFGVMGGIFGEGIDLKHEQLIGVIVVGTGLPQVSNEREILKNYYDKHSENGFDYAFRYPGMNKVLQAAGRVIRTVDDKGIILLLDERFLQKEYDLLYPREWSHRQICGIEQVQDKISKFWRQAN
ncbi:MAG: ATP-dependent DNA helicase [Agathobacter sp.]|nr:ATP-dependent DNA helicase [Agathobacter sp.]